MTTAHDLKAPESLVEPLSRALVSRQAGTAHELGRPWLAALVEPATSQRSGLLPCCLTAWCFRSCSRPRARSACLLLIHRSVGPNMCMLLQEACAHCGMAMRPSAYAVMRFVDTVTDTNTVLADAL